MRRSELFFYYMVVNGLLLVLIFGHAATRQRADSSKIETTRHMVASLGLSDLCLFTDARYTRHPSIADLHTAFQDYPMSFEHFPSGAILTVPQHLRPEMGSMQHALD